MTDSPRARLVRRRDAVVGERRHGERAGLAAVAAALSSAAAWFTLSEHLGHAAPGVSIGLALRNPAPKPC